MGLLCRLHRQPRGWFFACFFLIPAYIVVYRRLKKESWCLAQTCKDQKKRFCDDCIAKRFFLYYTDYNYATERAVEPMEQELEQIEVRSKTSSTKIRTTATRL